jgi:hypothetical protein
LGDGDETVEEGLVRLGGFVEDAGIELGREEIVGGRDGVDVAG